MNNRQSSGVDMSTYPIDHGRPDNEKLYRTVFRTF